MLTREMAIVLMVLGGMSIYRRDSRTVWFYQDGLFFKDGSVTSTGNMAITGYCLIDDIDNPQMEFDLNE